MSRATFNDGSAKFWPVFLDLESFNGSMFDGIGQD